MLAAFVLPVHNLCTAYVLPPVLQGEQDDQGQQGGADDWDKYIPDAYR